MIEGRYGVFSHGLKHNPVLRAAFAPDALVPLSWWLDRFRLGQKSLDGLLVWGRKPPAQRALRLARRAGLPVITLEDGFIRSVGLGSAGWPGHALVVDPVGVYFDAHQPSRLEQLIEAQGEPEAAALQLMQAVVAGHWSKYNHAPARPIRADRQHRQVLVVDQTCGDQSVVGAGADAQTFLHMLAQALQDHPDAQVWVKTHPDVSARQRQGYLSQLPPALRHRVQLLTEALCPMTLLAQMDEVYVVSSHMGFEALLLGRRVHCFGAAWYAGWGLTVDHFQRGAILGERRACHRSVAQLFTAAYLHYSHYLHPLTRQPCDLSTLLRVLQVQRHWNDQWRGEVYFLDFSRWKQRFLRAYFALPSVQVHFVSSAQRPPADLPQPVQLVVWGRRELPAAWQQVPHRLWRMEDGFVRSSGLGAQLIAPLSLVLDPVGIYFDATQPSRLEHLLAGRQLSAAERGRIRAIRQQLIDRQVSKYNVGERGEAWPPVPPGRPCLLVPGQVEDDASVRYGSPQLRSNQALLQAVRARHPEAFIVYKPHPDVLAGLRAGQIDDPVAQGWADALIEQMPMPDCLQHCDAVHTLTSLAGFEALIRGVPVVCYGQPFYAGWGLTEDVLPLARRTARLDLDTLMHAVLIDYPLYTLGPEGGGLGASLEEVLQQLGQQPAPAVRTLRNRLWGLLLQRYRRSRTAG